MIELRARCAACGDHLRLTDAHGRFNVHCDRCYDPADDASDVACLLGRGATPEDAFADYTHQANDTDLPKKVANQ